MQVIGSHGKQLLDWLESYTFPEEAKFSDKAYADSIADFFFQELHRNGTTSALCFATVHPESVNAIFEKATSYNMQLACGKVLMDQHSPSNLQEPFELGFERSVELIKAWHHKERLDYAITPRFALTSSPEALDSCKKLLAEASDLMVQTHIAENKDEIKAVLNTHPGHETYLDIYHAYGLVGSRSVFAHCIHFTEHEWNLMNKQGASIAFCPTSNTFLGSGLFPIKKAQHYEVKTSLGTDVGGGTSYSMIKTMAEAYKIAQLQEVTLSAFDLLYLATLGGATALHKERDIGSLEPGKYADFIVIDPASVPALNQRLKTQTNLEEELFALITLGDDRVIKQTYIAGQIVAEI